MNAEDFQDLYKLLRGSKSAFGVLDARTLFIEKKMQAALAKMIDSHDSYANSRSRLMKQEPKDQVDAKAKDAERQIKRIQRKQEKVREILTKFDEMLPKLRKLADKESEKEVAPHVNEAGSTENANVATVNQTEVRRPVTPADVSLEFTARFIETEGDKQLELISRHFGFQPIESEDDIYPNSVYFIRIQDESFLVHTRGEKDMANSVPLVSVVDEIPMKTYKRDAFVRLGTRRRMVLLTTTNAPSQSWPDSVEVGGDSSEADAYMETQTEIVGETVQNIDSESGKGADGLSADDFTLLVESAQRCGLVPDTDQIAHFRDREFRLGCYDMVLPGIEAIFANFTTAASKLNQQLASEEKAIKAGQVPADKAEAKRNQNRKTIQAVKEANTRFQQVINGLQGLMQAED